MTSTYGKGTKFFFTMLMDNPSRAETEAFSREQTNQWPTGGTGIDGAFSFVLFHTLAPYKLCFHTLSHQWPTGGRGNDGAFYIIR